MGPKVTRVVAALNNEITRAINMKPNNDIKRYIPGKPQDSISQPILSNITVRHLFEPGELEGGIARATDPIWSFTTHKIYTNTINW